MLDVVSVHPVSGRALSPSQTLPQLDWSLNTQTDPRTDPRSPAASRLYSARASETLSLRLSDWILPKEGKERKGKERKGKERKGRTGHINAVSPGAKKDCFKQFAQSND